MSDPKDNKPKRPFPQPETASAAAAIEAVGSPEPTIAVSAAAPVVTLPQPFRPRPQTAPADLFATYRNAVAAFGESQRAIANGFKALALEMSGIVQSNLTAAGDGAAALAKARTAAEAVGIQLGFARRSVDAMMAGSLRLSEIGTRLANDAARPIVAPSTGSPRTG